MISLVCFSLLLLINLAAVPNCEGRTISNAKSSVIGINVGNADSDADIESIIRGRDEREILVKVEELEEIITTTEKPRPYAFGYAAGRAPGHFDRTHSEISDGHVKQGSFSYIDPSHQIRTVEYTADKYGFHPSGANLTPKDTKAVLAAKEKHEKLFAQIAHQHSTHAAENLPKDTPAVARAKAAHLQLYEELSNLPPGTVVVPVASPVVQKATQKHLELYAKIAAS